MTSFVRRMVHAARAMNMSFGLVFSAIILPNIVMHITAWVATTPRSLFMLDYVVVALLIEAAAATRARILFLSLAALTFFLATVGELMQHLGNVFLFDLRQVINYLSFIEEWPLGLVISGFIAFLTYMALVLGLSIKASGRTAHSKALFSISGLAFCFILPITLLIGERALDQFGRPNLAEVRVGQTVIAGMRAFNKPTTDPYSEPTMQTNLQERAELPDQILSISFESWGTMEGDQSRYVDLTTHRFQQLLKDDYTITIGKRLFTGSTLTAELRELCTVKLHGAADKALAEGLAPHCLPIYLKAKGYVTHAAHGYYATFYNRHELYPALGFAYSHFRKTIEADPTMAAVTKGKPWAAYCDGLKYFRGPCDAPLVAYVLNAMKDDKKAFGHIMTKDLHFPFPHFSNNIIKCDEGALKEVEDFCAYVKFTELLFSEIADAIMQAERKPDLIFVYGDHRPHTENPALREQFSQTHVPVMVLERKTP